MEELNRQVSNNINANIKKRFAKGESKLSIKKFVDYIEDKFNIDADADMISKAIDDTKNSTVTDIDDKNINLGSKKAKDEESVNNDIHDNAVDQAVSNLKNESVADAISTLKTGMIVDSTKIKLDENNLFYPLHQGAIKAKRNYIIGTIVPKQDLNESFVECKIEHTGLFIELPIKCFVK